MNGDAGKSRYNQSAPKYKNSASEAEIASVVAGAWFLIVGIPVLAVIAVLIAFVVAFI